MTTGQIETPPFQSYKESNIPWAPIIPEHWETKRAKSLFKKMERPVSESDEVVTCFRDGTVTLRRNRRESGFTESLKEIGYQGIRPEDLVIHAMDAFAGAVGVSDSAGKGTPVYSICTPIGESNSHYYAHVLREMSRNKWIEALAKGVRERSSDFRFTEFGTQVLPIPLPEEQAAIVRFLDHADEQIQYYIAGKERLIALLEEQRQALVHQAVTRGLDPNVRLKPSGVEWLGDVPEHWELRRIRSLAAIGTGDKDTINRDVEGKYPFFVRSQNVERIDTWSFDGEAVLTAGDGAGVGKVFHYFNGKFDFHQRVYKFSDFKDILGKFFYYSLKASLPYLTQQGTAKSTVDSLRLPMLQNIKTTVPPSEEQEKLTRYLEQAEHRIDYAVAQAHRQIDLMTEVPDPAHRRRGDGTAGRAEGGGAAAGGTMRRWDAGYQ